MILIKRNLEKKTGFQFPKILLYKIIFFKKDNGLAKLFTMDDSYMFSQPTFALKYCLYIFVYFLMLP